MSLWGSSLTAMIRLGGLLLQSQLAVYLLICTYVYQCPHCHNADFCFHGGNQGLSNQEVHCQHLSLSVLWVRLFHYILFKYFLIRRERKKKKSIMHDAVATWKRNVDNRQVVDLHTQHSPNHCSGIRCHSLLFSEGNTWPWPDSATQRVRGVHRKQEHWMYCSCAGPSIQLGRCISF